MFVACIWIHLPEARSQKPELNLYFPLPPVNKLYTPVRARCVLK